jgi:enamine deaminase RidA (YjgF/YER057c/UK114 family)
MRAQILQVAENLRIALEVAGATFKDLVKRTTYVTRQGLLSSHAGRLNASTFGAGVSSHDGGHFNSPFV